ncbi:hypothetical protein GCM10010299_02460 [Streptomyces tanashiensis]|nr:hypothetical protein GCM10010299_02460 [Streptomyces tanashiensis]
MYPYAAEYGIPATGQEKRHRGTARSRTGSVRQVGVGTRRAGDGGHDDPAAVTRCGGEGPGGG